ncbi:MAG: PEGA domain-containing protein, partial [Candidatus Marinimicrobia bacterium]|nr:PEGA domain-containing protein [Candidatus Neomarinimicrobiota bacterium]
MKVKALIVLLILSSHTLAADRIAILDFLGEGVTNSQTKTFTDRVRNALVGYSQFEVMEREKFEAIMEEQQMNLSGICNEDCIVEVGQIAGVQYMVSGDVRSLGNTIFVAARIIDVETSKLMASQDIIVPSNDIGALLKAAPELADAIMQQFVEKKGIAAGGFQTIVDDSELGKLKLSISESGIQLIIDGRSRGTISRKDIIIQLSPGQHDIQIIKDGFETEKTTVAIQPKLTTSRTMNLKSTGEAIEQLVDWSFLTITSTPDQAMVVIDGIEYGQTFFQDKIAPGKHTIQLTKPLYYSVVKEIELDPGGMLPLDLKLKPNYGSVTVTSDPSGARIMLNDRQELQSTPHTVTPLQSGQYDLSISFPDYREHTQTVTISDGVETKINAILIPAFGWLNLSSNPTGAQVLIDGRDMGTTPIEGYRLPSGNYVLSVRTEYYKEYQQMITVEDGKTLTQDVALLADFGRLSVQGFPEGARITVDGKFRGKVPSIIEPVSVGSHKVKIEAGEHYKSHEQEIFIGLNDMAGIQVNLKELSGSLIASSNPPGASIIVDGKIIRTEGNSVAVTPYTIPKLWTGKHEVTFKLASFAESTQTITIQEDKREVLQVNLDKLIYIKSRKQAVWRSAILPGLGQFYAERP